MLAGAGGYKFAKNQASLQSGNLASPLSSSLNETMSSSVMAEQQLAIITRHIGRIEANILRINALGERLVLAARLDPHEFNFSHEVGVGGPATPEQINLALLLDHLLKFDALLEKRLVQLNTLQQILQTHLGQRELSFTGAGRAVTNGWISSFFGYRYDPFTGRKAWHSGVDIAGKEGSEIRALASGVVSFAAVKGAYGRMVEINHGNGLTTRYGHTKSFLVNQGDLVRKGQPIALLGSTGRSTAPHLHLEVHKNGKAIDPGIYFPDFQRDR